MRTKLPTSTGGDSLLGAYNGCYQLDDQFSTSNRNCDAVVTTVITIADCVLHVKNKLLGHDDMYSRYIRTDIQVHSFKRISPIMMVVRCAYTNFR
ncbi:unnamed protein product [Calypogeia fissa]